MYVYIRMAQARYVRGMYVYISMALGRYVCEGGLSLCLHVCGGLYLCLYNRLVL